MNILVFFLSLLKGKILVVSGSLVIRSVLLYRSAFKDVFLMAFLYYVLYQGFNPIRWDVFQNPSGLQVYYQNVRGVRVKPN